MITTNERFENFIEDDHDRFSEIELRVLGLEKDITAWREARTRQVTRPARRRQRERGAAGPGYPREPEPDLASRGYRADFTEPDIGLSWEAGEAEPGWEAGEAEPDWDDDDPEPGWEARGREPGWDGRGPQPGWKARGPESGWDGRGPQPGWEASGPESGWDDGGGEPGWEAGGRESGWDDGGPESGWEAGGREPGEAVTFRGAGGARPREFLRAVGQPPLGHDSGRTQALIDHGRQTARSRTIRRQPARPDTGRQDPATQDPARQKAARQKADQQKTSGQKTSGQKTARPKTARSGAARRGRSRHGRAVAIGSVAGLAAIGIGAMIILRAGPSWPASVATVRNQITTACQNPNVAAEPSQVDFACAKDTSQILWVFSLLTSGDDPGYADAKTGRKGLEPITPTQGGEIAWSLNMHHPYNPLSAVDSLEVAARAINNIIGGATLTSTNGTPTVQPGLESKPENCARYTGSAAIIAHAGFPSLCASPVTSREGQAALVADVYKQWMPGASPVAAQNASVLFQNAGNPGDPQVQEILKSLPHGE